MIGGSGVGGLSGSMWRFFLFKDGGMFSKLFSVIGIEIAKISLPNVAKVQR